MNTPTLSTITKTIKRNILLNPGPATTTDTVKSALLVEDVCPRENEFGNVMGEVRRGLLRVVKAENTHECVLFTSSGTGGVEACLSSIVPQDKKILVIDNGAYGKRMFEICQAFGVQVELLQFPWGQPVDLDLLEEKILDTNDLHALAFVHHETTVGLLNPTAPICSIAKKYNLVTVLDAMSSFAGMAIDANEEQIDFLVSSSNKCIQAMPGISFVIAKKEALHATQHIKGRNYYFNLYNNFKSQEFTNQSLFTPAVQVVYSLKAAIDEFFQKGPEARYQRYEDNYFTLAKGVKELGLEFLVAEEHHAKLLTAIVEPDHANYSFERMHDYFYERGITIYPGKGGNKNAFRIAVIGEIDHTDISCFLTELKNYLNQL